MNKKNIIILLIIILVVSVAFNAIQYYGGSSDFEKYLELGNLYLAKQEYEDALNYFEKAEIEKPSNLEVHNVILETREKIDNMEKIKEEEIKNQEEQQEEKIKIKNENFREKISELLTFYYTNALIKVDSNANGALQSQVRRNEKNKYTELEISVICESSYGAGYGSSFDYSYDIGVFTSYHEIRERKALKDIKKLNPENKEQEKMLNDLISFYDFYIGLDLSYDTYKTWDELMKKRDDSINEIERKIEKLKLKYDIRYTQIYG